MNNENQYEIANRLRSKIISDLCNQIDLKKQTIDARIPRGYISGLIKSHAAVCPWLNRDVINNELRRRKKNGIFDSGYTPAINITTSVTDSALVGTDPDLNRTKRGRPEGTTDENKKRYEYAILSSKNEIVDLIKKEREDNKNKRLPVGTLSNIIKAVTKRNTLSSHYITESCIKSRLKKQRRDGMILNATPGPTSPLLKYEPEFVSVIAKMARMRMALCPSECLELINALIDGKQAQRDLVAFKKEYKLGQEKTVGYGYWYAFKKRNEHLICSKRGQKYALDRDKWTTYANFADMYKHVYIEMADAGVAVKLTEPVWQDENGSPCNESSAFG